MDKHQKIAVLIDGDNISAAAMPAILAEIREYGTIGTKRIYGDWSNNCLQNWKETVLAYAIEPVQQFAYTKGKNATDIAMVIDAMDLLYEQTYDAFCLVSGDSDFAPLAARIRTGGAKVYGFGRKNTPLPFQKSCDGFVCIGDASGVQVSDIPPTVPEKSDKKALPQEIRRLILTAVQQYAGQDGWTHIGTVGSALRKHDSTFDLRAYGYPNLSSALAHIPGIRIKRKDNNYICRCEKPKKSMSEQEMTALLLSAIKNQANKNGWVSQTTIEAYFTARSPYQHIDIPALIKRTKGLQIATGADQQPGQTVLYCRKIPYLKLITVLRRIIEKYQDTDGKTALAAIEKEARYYLPYGKYGFTDLNAFLSTVDGLIIEDDTVRFQHRNV